MNRLGVVGLLFSLLPVMAGFSLGSLIGAIVSPSKTPPPPVPRTPAARPNASTPQNAPPAGAQASRAAGALLCSVIPFLLFHAATWFAFKKVTRDRTEGTSVGFWRAVFGGAYVLGLVLGLVLVFTM